MKILIDITHPAHVHFFKYAIKDWQAHGHQVIITSRDKDLTLCLLDRYKFRHTTLSRARKGIMGLGLEMLERGRKLWSIVRSERPAVLTAIGGTFIAPIGKLTGTPVVIFTDTEHAKISNAIAFPLADAICTPDCYEDRVGRKQITYAGYQELAYLHPNRFIPNPKVLSEIGLTEKDIYFIVRFVSWGAAHDVGYRGFSDSGKRRLVAELGKLGRVIITSEAQLPPDFEPYRMSVSPTKIHDLLAYSSLYIGEGATMASEAALLGIPSIYVNPLTLGYLEDEERYGLLYRLPDESEAIERAVALISTPNIRAEWQRKRRRLLQDKIDVTAWMVDFVEGYVQATSGKDVSK